MAIAKLWGVAGRGEQVPVGMLLSEGAPLALAEGEHVQVGSEDGLGDNGFRASLIPASRCRRAW